MDKKPTYFLVLDQGTSSSKVFLFTPDGEIVYTKRARHHLEKPAPNHVESDALEILYGCYELLENALEFAKKDSGTVISAGLAVQRSTFLFWDKSSGKPISPAISWQDSRSSIETKELEPYADFIFSQTGAPLSSHFGGPKFLHMVRNHENIKTAVDRENVWYGPLSSFLSYSFTGKSGVDESIAGRSLFTSIAKPSWDNDLCSIFNVPDAVLPDLLPTVHNYGTMAFEDIKIPLKCVIGDQQAALIGQGGLKSGDLAMNFGTSGSVQFNAGEVPKIIKGLLSSVLYSTDNSRSYLLEGTINSCNSLFYKLEEDLKIPHKEMLWHDRCDGIITEGFYLPGTGGIAAPYWQEGIETSCTVPKENTNEYIRAGMESIGYLVNDIMDAVKKEIDISTTLVTASGGGSRHPLLQFISDLTGLMVGHATLKDRTAYGVFNLLKKEEGLDTTTSSVACDHISTPIMDKKTRTLKIDQWRAFLLENGISYNF